MPITSKHDVIVVGAGPAGSTAAFLLNRLGLDVLVIDKCVFPRDKLCGGLITHKTLELLERVFNETEASLNRKCIIDYKSDSYKVTVKEKLLAAYPANPPLIFVNRSVYDDFFLTKVKDEGVEVIEGDGVTSVDLDKCMITTSSGKQFFANFVIGADGVNSIVRRSFPREAFNQRKWNHDLATAIEVFVPRVDTKTMTTEPIVSFGNVNWGYAWVFPNKDRLVVGVGGLTRANKDFRGLMEKFLYTLDLNELSTSKMKGHLVPYGNFLTMPVCGKGVLLGDAAGLVDPIIGEGIYYAHRSAELVSRSINLAVGYGEDLGVVYKKLLRKFVYPELTYAKKLRWILFWGLDNFGYYPLKLLFGMLDPMLIELIHGIRSYRWLRKRGDTNG